MATARKMLDQPAEDLQHHVEDVMADIVDRSSRATGELLDAEGSLTSLWLELTHSQVTHNLEAMQELMECRDWRAAGQVQQDYIQASIARLGETMSRHLGLTSEMATRFLPRDEAPIAPAA